ncbi:hypothetical protein GCM10011371_04970 [Novosphingobium marinum]|uniref:Ice-binding protein C-terminal domain-containing protein n=1 Tax=Novosphingobium marinum TaxID=1514948 RepID=A0A7Y9XW45_9SPHN|nr:cistern family PEP-CTERM protein [Novosphingobium marinum]NYH94186.1 hypothetical protein [Novosphingobium marinum]GGC20274.1 hypothetical protein GCM10011371_04970 [Novosphingobium marinum]
MNLRATLACATAIAGLALSSPALADAITLDSSNIGDSFTVNYDGFADGNPIDGLTGTATFTLTGISGSSYMFDYSVSNTSSMGVDSRISSFAFDVDPSITGASSTGDFPFTVLDSNYPNGIGNVDVCFKGGSSNSCAGNSGGVTAGNTGSGSLSLDFAGGSPNAITLDDFFVRYQSITGAGNVTSASGSGTISSTGGSTGGTPVPEPGMLGLLGLGLAGLAFARGRARRKMVPAAA